MFVRFVRPIGLLASQTSPWCLMETADNLPANMTGNCIIHHEYYHVMYTCTHYVTPAIKIPLQHKRHFTRTLLDFSDRSLCRSVYSKCISVGVFNAHFFVSIR